MHLYAYKVPKSAYISDILIEDFTEFNEFAYWTNHQELYQWFEDLWVEKGGCRTNFNCEFVVVTKEDIYKLIERLPFENREWNKEDKLFNYEKPVLEDEDFEDFNDLQEAMSDEDSLFYQLQEEGE